MDKITSRQICIMFLLTTMSPAIRLFPSSGAKHAGAAGWLAPIAASAVFLILIPVLSGLFKKGRAADLSGAFDAAFGRFTGKLLLVLYLIWTITLFLLYVRYYAERLVSSLFTSSGPDFFVITMLACVFFAARMKLSALARFSELSVLVFAIALTVFFVSLLPTFRAENVLPVTYYDTLPVLRGTYPIVSVWGFLTLFFFLGEQVENKSDFIKHGRNTAILLAIATSLMVLLVVGSLGPSAAQRMPLPFFKVSKLIDIMQSFDRFEAVLASVWVIADFILITAFAFIITAIIRKLFNLSDARRLAGPVAMLGWAGGMLIASGTYELERFSSSPLTHIINLSFCLIIPSLTLAAGRIRGKL